MAAPTAPATVNGYRLVHEPDAEDALQAWVYELDNGLTVYLTHNDQDPRFYAEIAVRVGSKEDPPDTTGLAHYLEHMLFKGTTNFGTIDFEAEKPHLDRIRDLYEEHFHETDPERRREIYAEINRVGNLAARYAAPNELDRMYSAMGGSRLNAHTWRDETVYKVDLPSNRLEQWAIVETERFAQPVFRLFHTELEVVYEEKNRAMDNKDRVIFDAVNEQLYLHHPYGQQTTLGSAEHLRNPSIKRIEEYYEKWYVPENMAIVISGDIDHAEAIEVIAGHFNEWEARPVPERGQWEEPPLDSVRRVEVQYPAEDYVQLAWRTAPAQSEDRFALRILDMILDNANAGLINLNLNQRQLVRSAGSFPLMDNDHGSQYLWGVPRTGQTHEEVEQLLLEQIELVRNGEFEDWIIPAIVNDFRKREEGMLESNLGRVSTLRSSFLEERPWHEAKRDLDRLAEVTREDVVRVANKYFSDGYVAGYRRNGPHDYAPIEKPPIDPLEMDTARQSEFAENLLAMEVEPIEPLFIDREEAVTIRTVAEGRTLYHSLNPLNNLFDLQLVVERGTDHEPALLVLSGLVDKAGTETLAPDELQKEWYKLATDFRVSTNNNQTIVTVSGLDDQFPRTLEKLAEFLASPSVEQGVLDELVADVIQDREDARANPQRISSALFTYNRYGADSPLLAELSDEDLRALNVEDVLVLLVETPEFEHSILYTGPRSAEEVAESINRHLPVASEPRPEPEYRFRPVRRPEATEILFVPQETAQSQVRVESAGPEVNEERAPLAALYNEYFAGGMSGIVYQTLREARALAYVAGAAYRRGSRLGEEDIMIGVIGTQVDKTVEAVEGLLDLIENLPEEPDRFARTRASIDNSYRTSRVGFRDVIPSVRTWERLGLEEGDPREERYRRILESTLEEIVAFQREVIHGQPRLISIVGDPEHIDLEELARFGTIREVDVDEIFPPRTREAAAEVQ